MDKEDKKIKELLKGNFDEPTPSADFTKNIMERIVSVEVQKEQNEFEYVPVISKLGWIFISALFMVVVYLGIIGGTETTLNASHFAQYWQFDSSLLNSPLTLFAVLSIFSLLIIDRLLVRFKMT